MAVLGVFHDVRDPIRPGFLDVELEQRTRVEIDA